MRGWPPGYPNLTGSSGRGQHPRRPADRGESWRGRIPSCQACGLVVLCVPSRGPRHVGASEPEDQAEQGGGILSSGMELVGLSKGLSLKQGRTKCRLRMGASALALA